MAAAAAWSLGADVVLRHLRGVRPINVPVSWLRVRLKLDRPGEALEPLRTFVNLCHDEPDHPEAAALLKKLESEKTAGGQ